MRLASLAFAVSIAACSPPAATPPSAKAPTISTPPPVGANAITAEGWGPLRVGMTREAVIAAVGATATPNSLGEPDPESCDLFHPARTPEGMLVMI